MNKKNVTSSKPFSWISILRFFKKKGEEDKAVVVPRRFEIPAENVFEILKLADAAEAAPVGARRKYNYSLWSRISELCPEVSSGRWVMRSPTALRVEIVEEVESE